MKVNDIIGKALPSIGAYKKLDNTKQVVALIDDVSSLFMNELMMLNVILIAGLVHQLWKMLYDLQ